jgi:Sulfotransferase family
MRPANGVPAACPEVGMIASRKKRFIFVHVPKVAGTSIQNALKPYDDCRHLKAPTKHEPISSFLARVGDPFPSFLKFAFFRNPWDRMASFFQYAKGRVPEFPDTFDTFLRDLQDGKDYAVKFHSVRPQLDFVTNVSGEIIVDFIGSFEHLERDYEEVCSEIGIKAPLGHFHASRRERSYRELYDTWSRDFISNRYEREIEQFGFRF